MKSEHRHELEANSLAGFLNNLPENLRKHSNKIFLVVAAGLLVFAGLRYRDNQQLIKEQETRTALASAWDAAGQLRNMQIAFLRARPESIGDIVKTRNELLETGNRSAQQVISDSEKPKDASRMASAWLARAELFWTLANLPETPGATTRPELAPKQTPSEALDIAANAYNTILKDFGDQVEPAISARFGLAAIAENKGDFAAAQEQYKALLESEASAPTDKAIAQQRIVKLDDLRKPLLLLPATQPATQPTITDNRPITPGIPNLLLGAGSTDVPLPTTQATPSTRPATRPATVPSTQPQ